MKTSLVAFPVLIAVTFQIVNAILLSPIRTDIVLLAQQPTSTQSSLEQQAVQLDDEARKLYIRGDRQEALDKLYQALSIYRRIGDLAGERRILTHLPHVKM